MGQAVSGVLAAVVALADPELIVVGGSWGAHPVVFDAICTAFAGLPRHVALRSAELTVEPSLSGARIDALKRPFGHCGRRSAGRESKRLP